MARVLVTGANGFLGKNLVDALRRDRDVSVEGVDVTNDPDDLGRLLDTSEVVFHLAGVNRPQHEEEYRTGNAGLTKGIVDHLLLGSNRPILLLASSIQAAYDNPYGISKRDAEREIERYGANGGRAVIARFPNVFGKWSQPNYNTVVATFCHNIARGLDIAISDPQRVVDLIYIDDVVRSCLRILRDLVPVGLTWMEIGPISKISLADLAAEIVAMRDIRSSLIVPDLSNYFRRCLYATYLSFLPEDAFRYDLAKRTDERGTLAELLRSAHFGQIFISRTKPGVTRGNHFHDTKVEKFCVVQGDAIVRFRQVAGLKILEYAVKGEQFSVLDIPPGYTHSIENVGATELVVLFWSSEPFDHLRPDTYPASVQL